MPHAVPFYKNMFSNMKSLRSNWESIWTDVDKFVYGFTGSYDSNPVKGQMTYENVYDHTATNANTVATNAFVGILWQPNGRALKISPADELKDDSESIKWMKETSDRFSAILDDPNSRLVSSLTEYTAGALSHGSGGVGVFRNGKSPVLFRPYSVRTLYFMENEEGEPDTLALRSWMPAYQVVEKYGEENVSSKVLKDSQSPTQRSNEVEVIQFIMPSKEEGKPWSSVHIDMDNDTIMKDSFYEELPIKVGRIEKTSFEVYGRGPAINSLSNIKRLNAVVGDVLEATEKLGRNAMGMYSNATLGNGVLDLSAGAVNMFNSQATNGPPIFPINDIGDLNSSYLMIDRLQKGVETSYSIDKLITMLTESFDTATQALIIDRIRNTSLGALLSRQINEVYTPLMETTFNLLFNDGVFGVIEGSPEFNKAQIEQQLTGQPFEIEVIPKKIADLYNQGKAIYKVEYLTPAARMLASEEANNIVEASRVTAEFAQVNPAALDNIEGDDSLRRFYELKGLEDLLVAKTDVQEIRDIRLEQQQKQLEQEQAQAEAQTAATEAGAEQSAQN